MSALGQKQTYAVQNGMPALPPIATVKADMPQWSCPLYPKADVQRTSVCPQGPERRAVTRTVLVPRIAK